MTNLNIVTAKLTNGFSFIVDFCEGLDTTCIDAWKEYYGNRAESITISEGCDPSSEALYSIYNAKAFTLFDMPYSELECKWKLSVVELVGEGC